MLRNLFARREDARTVMQSPDATTSSARPRRSMRRSARTTSRRPVPPRRDWAPHRELSPIVRAAATRITGHPVA